MAKYAKAHGALFRRILAVIKNEEGTLLSLDLKNPDVAAKLAAANNETDIRKVFSDLGGGHSRH